MKLHYWKFFCFITYATTMLTPVLLMTMQEEYKIEEEMETLGQGYYNRGHYPENNGEFEVRVELEPFTRENTKVALITGKSFGKFIENNTKIIAENWNCESLEDVIQTSGLEYAQDLSIENTQAILNGINILSRDLNKFGIYKIDLTSPNALSIYKKALGRILQQYFEYQEREYGFSVIALLKNETELWLGEIPSKEKISNLKKGSEHPLNEKLNATKKEVDAAFAIFEPFLDKLFIEGQPEATQERRKTCWMGTKDCALVLVICYIIMSSLIGLGTGVWIAIVNTPGVKCP